MNPKAKQHRCTRMHADEFNAQKSVHVVQKMVTELPHGSRSDDRFSR